MSNKERAAKLRERRRAAGQVAVTIWMNAETREKLIQIANGNSRDRVVERLIQQA